eukprot:5719573-Prorocentrum_lima.AAC.1
MPRVFVIRQLTPSDRVGLSPLAARSLSGDGPIHLPGVAGWGLPPVSRWRPSGRHLPLGHLPRA